MAEDNRPIGVFDSGVGGISVLGELIRLMPNENFIYFGDSRNAPYGTKPHELVRELTLATAALLTDARCKCLVIACNTATAAAVRPLRELYPTVPVIGIEPSIKPAVLANPNGHVLVMATAVTLGEDKFLRLMAKYDGMAHISTLACPGIVEFVERGVVEGEELDAYLKELLADYIENPPDAAVLGCTHYPFVRRPIAKALGKRTQIYDGGGGTAREALRQLKLHGLLAAPGQIGSVVLRNSNGQAAELSRRLLEIARNL
ncbi:MAG: glutamate racemase [Butyrivibrio sp.]|nr:glutamate racemase [Butyrivibrio sp.]